MARPKTGDTRKMVTLPAELAQAIEDYRFTNRLKTEAEAIRRLIEAGLNTTNLSLSGGEPGEADKPAGNIAPTRMKPATPARKAEPAAPRSKLDQIRALREQGAR